MATAFQMFFSSFFPNVVFAEVPQCIIIHIQAFSYKIDSWTDRAFKGFAANAQCYLNALHIRTYMRDRLLTPTHTPGDLLNSLNAL